MITPVQKLKIPDYPVLEDETLMFISNEEVEEFKDYVKELIKDPTIAYPKAQKILFLYAEAIRYIVNTADENTNLNEDLPHFCHVLAKALYFSYKDVNLMMYCRQIEQLWKAYTKLCRLIERIPNTQSTRVAWNKDRIAMELGQLSKHIRTCY